MKFKHSSGKRLAAVSLTLAIMANFIPGDLLPGFGGLISDTKVSAVNDEIDASLAVHGTAPAYAGSDDLYNGEDAIAALPRTVTYKDNANAPSYITVTQLLNNAGSAVIDNTAGFNKQAAENALSGRKLMVCNAVELMNLSRCANSISTDERSLYLGADILIGSNIEWSELSEDGLTNNFDPIGSSEFPFTGTIDGQGFEIRDLIIRTDSGYQKAAIAFVGYLGQGGAVRNLGIYHPAIISANVSVRAAVVVGDNDGLVENVYAIVDEFNSHAELVIESVSDSTKLTNIFLLNSLSTSAAGIVAKNGANGRVKASYFAGTFTVPQNVAVGPICGDYIHTVSNVTGNSGTIENCYYDKTIFDIRHGSGSTLATAYSGITGLTNLQIKKLGGNMDSTTRFKRISAYVCTPDESGSSANASHAAQVYSGQSSNEEDYGYPRLYGFGGTGTSADPFTISTPADLVYFPTSAEAFCRNDGLKLYFSLKNCIDMSEAAPFAYKPAEKMVVFTNKADASMSASNPLSWSKDDPFTGEFVGTAHDDEDCVFQHITGRANEPDRQSHIIYSLTINDTYNNTQYVYPETIHDTEKRSIGLITGASCTETARPAVRDLHLVGGSMYAASTGSSYYRQTKVAAVASEAEFMDFVNVHSSADVSIGDVLTENADIGSLCADGHFKEVTDCTNSGTISAGQVICSLETDKQTYRVGGLLGNASAIDMEACEAKYKNSGYIGRVVHCANYGVVSGPMLLTAENETFRLVSDNPPESYTKVNGIDTVLPITSSTLVSGITTAFLGTRQDQRMSVPANTAMNEPAFLLNDKTRSERIANFGEITDVPVRLDASNKVELTEVSGKNYTSRPTPVAVPAGMKSISEQSPNHYTYLFGIAYDRVVNSVNTGDFYGAYLSKVFSCGICFGISNIVRIDNDYGCTYNYNNVNKGDFSFYNGSLGACGLTMRYAFNSLNEGDINVYDGSLYSHMSSTKGGVFGIFQGGSNNAVGCYNSGRVYLAPSSLVSISKGSVNGSCIAVSGLSIFRSYKYLNNYLSVNAANVVFDGETNHFTTDISSPQLYMSGTGGGAGNDNYGNIRYIPNSTDSSKKTELRVCGSSSLYEYNLVNLDLSNCVNYADIYIDGMETLRKVTVAGTIYAGGTSSADSISLNIRNLLNLGDITVRGSYREAVTAVGCARSTKNTAFTRCVNLGNVNIDADVDSSAPTTSYMCAYGFMMDNSNNSLRPYLIDSCINGWQSGKPLPQGVLTDDAEDPINIALNGLDPARAYGRLNMTGRSCAVRCNPFFVTTKPISSSVIAGGADQNTVSNSFNSRLRNSVNYADILIDQYYSEGNTSTPNRISGLSSHGIADDCKNYGNIHISDCLFSCYTYISGASAGNRNINYGDITVESCVMTTNTQSTQVFAIAGCTDFFGGNKLENFGNIVVRDTTQAEIRGTVYNSMVYGRSENLSDSDRKEIMSIYVGGIQSCDMIQGNTSNSLWNDNKIQDCVNYGNISLYKLSQGVKVGGIIGSCSLKDNSSDETIKIKRCLNYGDITTEDVSCYGYAVSGIVSTASAVALCAVSDCMNFGNIQCIDPNSYLRYNNNGETSRMTNFQIRIGGLVAYSSSGAGRKEYLTDCVNFGNISYNNSKEGGAGDSTPSSNGGLSIGGCMGYENSVRYANRVMNYGDVTLGNERNMTCRVGGIFGNLTVTVAETYINDGCGFINYGNVSSIRDQGSSNNRFVGGIIGLYNTDSLEGNTSGLRYALNYGRISSQNSNSGKDRIATLIGYYWSKNSDNGHSYGIKNEGFVNLGDFNADNGIPEKMIGYMGWDDSYSLASGPDAVHTLRNNAEDNRIYTHGQVYTGATAAPLYTSVSTEPYKVTLDDSDNDPSAGSIGVYNKNFLYRANASDIDNPFVYMEWEELSPFLKAYLSRRFGRELSGAYVMAAGSRSSSSFIPENMYLNGEYTIGINSSGEYTNPDRLSDKPLQTGAYTHDIYSGLLEGGRTIRSDLECFALQVDPDVLSKMNDIYDLRLNTRNYYLNSLTQDYEQFTSFRNTFSTQFTDDQERITQTDIYIQFPKENLDHTSFKTSADGSAQTGTSTTLLLDNILLSASEKSTIRLYQGSQQNGDNAVCPVTADNLSQEIEAGHFGQSMSIDDALNQSIPWTIDVDTSQASGQFNKVLGVITAENTDYKNIVYIHVFFDELVQSAVVDTVRVRTSYKDTVSGNVGVNVVSTTGNQGLVVERGKPSLSDDGVNDVDHYFLSDDVITGYYKGNGHNLCYYNVLSTTYNPVVKINTSGISPGRKVFVNVFRQDRIPSLEGSDYNAWNDCKWNDAITYTEDDAVAQYELTIDPDYSTSFEVNAVDGEMSVAGLYRFDMYYSLNSSGTAKKHFCSLFVWRMHAPLNGLNTKSNAQNVVTDEYFSANENRWGTDNTGGRYDSFGYAYYNALSKNKYGYDMMSFPVFSNGTTSFPDKLAYYINDAKLNEKEYQLSQDSPGGAVGKKLYNRINRVTLVRDTETGAEYPVVFRGTFEIMAENTKNIRAYTYDRIYSGKPLDSSGGYSDTVLGENASIVPSSYVVNADSVYSGSNETAVLSKSCATDQRVEVTWTSTNVGLFRNGDLPDSISSQTEIYGNDGYSASKLVVMYKAPNAPDSSYSRLTSAQVSSYMDVSVDSSGKWSFNVKSTAPRGTYKLVPYFEFTTVIGQYAPSGGIQFTDTDGAEVTPSSVDGNNYHWRIAYSPFYIENQPNDSSYITFFNIDNDTSIPVFAEDERGIVSGHENRRAYVLSGANEGKVVYSGYDNVMSGDGMVNKFVVTSTARKNTDSSVIEIKAPYRSTVYVWNGPADPVDESGNISDSSTLWVQQPYQSSGEYSFNVNENRFDTTPFVAYYKITSEDGLNSTVYTVQIYPEVRNKIMTVEIADEYSKDVLRGSLPEELADTYANSDAIYKKLLKEYGPLTVTFKELDKDGDVDYFQTKWFDGRTDDKFTVYNFKNHQYDISLDLPAGYDYDVFILGYSAESYTALGGDSSGSYDGKRLVLTTAQEQRVTVHIVLKTVNQPPWGVQYLKNTNMSGIYHNHLGQ